MKKRHYIFLFLLIATVAFGNQGAPPSFPIAPQIRGGTLQSVVVDRESVSVQNEILTEMKIFNLYMSKVTGETFTETDIE